VNTGDDPNFDGIYPDTRPGGFSGLSLSSTHPFHLLRSSFPLQRTAGAESCGIAQPANVISISYGGDEATFTPAYAARQCTEYAKLGLLGVTVLFSSGDNGVAGNGGQCLNPDGKPSIVAPSTL